MQGVLTFAGPALLAIAAGVSFVVQAAVNAQLRASLESPSWAAFVSYLGGTIIMAIVLLAGRASWPQAEAVAGSPWLSWTGGLFGAIYVIILIVLLPRLGTATTLALFVAGQMLASLAFDHFALFGLPRHAADAFSLVGAMLLIKR